MATELGALVIKEAVARAGIAANIVENVIMGMVIQAGAPLAGEARLFFPKLYQLIDKDLVGPPLANSGGG